MTTEAKELSISIRAFFQRFPDEEVATEWFEKQHWPGKMYCPHCGVVGNIAKVKNAKPMPWRCRECRKHFSVRTKSVLAGSPIPLQKWLMAAYLMSASRKGISSVQLTRLLSVTQKTAWFVKHRIREAYAEAGGLLGSGVELVETSAARNTTNTRASEGMTGSAGHTVSKPDRVEDRFVSVAKPFCGLPIPWASSTCRNRQKTRRL